MGQEMLQRYISLPTIRDANRALLLFTVLLSTFILICCYNGLLVYTWYADCDPLKTKVRFESSIGAPMSFKMKNFRFSWSTRQINFYHCFWWAYSATILECLVCSLLEFSVPLWVPCQRAWTQWRPSFWKILSNHSKLYRWRKDKRSMWCEALYLLSESFQLVSYLSSNTWALFCNYRLVWVVWPVVPFSECLRWD